MIRRIIVTLGALLLTATASPSANTHAIQFTISQPIDLRHDHVFLGVAVLGHHVGRIERGWLVKQAEPGYLHIDWSKSGQWAGLERTEQGPRDVSQAQVDEVVRVIEGLGYPASAIRAWRVPAPVGYDGFREGDKVLTIGEILVDLGTLDDARLALDRWWDVVLKDDKDPFEQIPRTNVLYATNLYFQPDCRVLSQQLRQNALDEGQLIAQTAASSNDLSATFSSYEPNVPETVLCPQDRQPVFYNANGGPPISIHDFDLVAYPRASVTYTLSGTALTRGTAPSAGDLRSSETQYEFPLNVPYAATIGEASVKMKPDAFVLQFTYDLGDKAAKNYAAQLLQAQTRIAGLQRLVPSEDVFVQRRPAKEREDEITVSVLVRGDDLAMLKNLMRAGREPSQSMTPTAFVSDCSGAMKTAVVRALAASRRKATMFAGLLHAKLGLLAASRIGNPIGANIVCGYAPGTPLSALVAQIPPSSDTTFNDTLDVSAATTVDAAWTLTETAHSEAQLVRAQYSADVRGTLQAPELENRALLQAAREAVVDNPHIVSLYETTETFEPGSAGDANYASATIVVLRSSNST